MRPPALFIAPPCGFSACSLAGRAGCKPTKRRGRRKRRRLLSIEHSHPSSPAFSAMPTAPRRLRCFSGLDLLVETAERAAMAHLAAGAKKPCRMRRVGRAVIEIEALNDVVCHVTGL